MDIRVKTIPTNLGWHFSVTINEPTGPSFYKVSMDKDFLTRIGAELHPEKVVEKSFEFLLEKEPKEKILQEFDIAEISTYYHEFIPELNKRLNY
jgi:hypothetical protein